MSLRLGSDLGVVSINENRETDPKKHQKCRKSSGESEKSDGSEPFL